MFTITGLPRKLFYDTYLKNPIAVFLLSNKPYTNSDKVNVLDKSIDNNDNNNDNNDKQNDILNINKSQDIASMEKIKRQKYVKNNVKNYSTHKMTSYIYKSIDTTNNNTNNNNTTNNNTNN
mgnify:CR=1 FL=1